MTIVLESPRLRATMWEKDDAGLIQSLHSTLETTRFLSGSAPWSRAKAEERLANWFAEQARDRVTKYKIVSRDDGRFIGRAGFSLYGGDRADYELGYSLCRSEWGKGYATEIASAFRDWFFARSFAPGFIAFTHPENAASQHVLTKIGMRSRMPMTVDGMACPTFELTAGMRSA